MEKDHVEDRGINGRILKWSTICGMDSMD